jgi:hypothetical protein
MGLFFTVILYINSVLASSLTGPAFKNSYLTSLCINLPACQP